MKRVAKTTEQSVPTRPVVRTAKARSRTIVAHIESAKARKSGTDITDFSPEALVADLLRHKVSV